MPFRIIVTVVYIIGIAMTAYLGVKCFLPPASELDPMAMIPFTKNERAFVAVAGILLVMLAEGYLEALGILP